MTTGDPLQAWEAAADAYAAFVHDDVRRKELLDPALDAMVGDVRGKRLLDLGCGTGEVAARYALAGATVTAVDGVASFVDATAHALAPWPGSRAQLWDLRRPLPRTPPFDAPFDLAVAHMLITSLPDPAPIFQSVRATLAPGGRFVLSLLHPAFTPPAAKVRAGFLGRVVPRLRRLVVLEYFQETSVDKVVQGSRLPPLPYYHRTLSTTLQLLGSAGFGVTAAAEPRPGAQSHLARSAALAHSMRAPLFLLLEARPLP